MSETKRADKCSIESERYKSKCEAIESDNFNLLQGENPFSGARQEPTEPSKQPIRARYLGHVTGYQPIRDQYFLVRSFPGARWNHVILLGGEPRYISCVALYSVRVLPISSSVVYIIPRLLSRTHSHMQHFSHV